jgi:hypothetical protein
MHTCLETIPQTLYLYLDWYLDWCCCQSPIHCVLGMQAAAWLGARIVFSFSKIDKQLEERGVFQRLERNPLPEEVLDGKEELIDECAEVGHPSQGSYCDVVLVQTHMWAPLCVGGFFVAQVLAGSH